MADDRKSELSVEFDECFGSDVLAIKLGVKKTASKKLRALQGPQDGYVRHWAQVDMGFRLQAGVWDRSSEGGAQLAS